MAVTLEQFIAEKKKAIEEFEVYWRKENAKDPKHFPMEMSEDNAGAWSEQLMIFEGY